MVSEAPHHDESDSDDSMDGGYQLEEESEEEKSVAEPADLLAPHGLRWVPVPAELNLLDPRGPRISTRLLWSQIDLERFGSSAIPLISSSQDPSKRTPFHYFLLSFPVALVHPILARTNNSISSSQRRQTQFTAKSFFKILGILYLMTLSDQPNRRAYWAADDNIPLPSPNFGRFMDISHFEHFMQHISWSELNRNDRWASIRDFINGFNARRVSTIFPSDRLTVDEAMSMNRTNRTVKNGVPTGLPHQTKIARKPEGVGSEIRCVIDGAAQIMLQLELQESKEEMATKKYAEDGEMAGTACVLRLVEPWFHSGRTVYGDSAFGSVNTALRLRKSGLHFLGLVKTAHKQFPKEYFKSLGVPARSGESRYCQTMPDNIPLYAVAWFDKKVKYIVATAGSNATGPPHGRIRYRLKDDGTSERYEKYTNTSMIPHEYFSFAQKIDVHNHRRQGILALERAIPTRSWAFRIIATVLGIIMVDAYMMYKLEHDGDEVLQFRQFVGQVSSSLCSNSISDTSLLRSRSAGGDGNSGGETEDNTSAAICSLLSLSRIVDRGQRKKRQIQLKCRICGEQASSGCARCSTGGKAFAICGPQSKSAGKCFAHHVANQ